MVDYYSVCAIIVYKLMLWSIINDNAPRRSLYDYYSL